ncbi:MAG TPA: peptidyl-dipeptidase Dcp [Gemmatimonadaceae bacterium]|jgi:peptidyl-dipeptidase Dcp
MLRIRVLSSASALLATVASSAVAQSAPQSAGTRQNPFLEPSPLFFQAPPFDKIRDGDYEPALERGMRDHLAEVNRIANQTSAPTFDNTIVPMEQAGALLTRVSKVFFGLTTANTDDTIQRIQAIEAPKLAAHSDAIYLNAKLFARVKSLYDRRTTLGLDSVQQYLVRRYYLDFVRDGAQLSDADKTTLRALNAEESKLTTQFQSKLLAATKAGALVIGDRAQLAGLSDADIASAAQDAKDRGLTGKWVVPLQNTTQQPAQASLSDRAVRRRLFEASTQRAEHGGSDDTRAVIARLAQLRAQRAKLLGYPTYAAYSLDDQMAKTPEHAMKLLGDLVPPATDKAHAEAAEMQALVDKQHGGFALEPWDWQYYAEQVRKAEFDLDESQLEPYFELDTVLKNGVFFAANKLYGITFKERTDIPVWHPDVRVFEVFDADGSPLALWYCDYFKRDNKGGGAWEDTWVDQSGLLGTHAVVYNVANFTKPAPGQPALLTFDDVTTMFHEFGHALHSMFSNVRYPTLAGTNVPRDFVEFPSQFNEHWALDSTVFANYAHHYQTGAPMPQALVEKIEKARTFNQGFLTTEYLSASLLDLAWHTLPASAPLQKVDTFESDALKRFHVDVALVPPRYRSTYFSHIWSGGYSAGYYAYLWSEVIDDDAFAWFTEHGGLTRANGQRFRDMLLSRGGTEDAAAMYRAFRGRDPSIEPLLEQRGLKATTTSQ